MSTEPRTDEQLYRIDDEMAFDPPDEWLDLLETAGALVPVEVDYGAMMAYLHSSIWSAWQARAMPNEDETMRMVETLHRLGIEGQRR